MRPIDADDFAKKMYIGEIVNDRVYIDIPTACKMIRDQLDKQPTLDVAKVVHAHWARPAHDYEHPYCSNCKNPAIRYPFMGHYMPDYCPKCGAKMDRRGE